MLTALTGGYRRTPVMQIGADIYCDSQCIIRELERRFPFSNLHAHVDQGLMWCLSRWTDGALFDQTLRHILGAAGDQLDQDFAADRGRLYLGEDWAAALKQANADLPHLVSQVRAPLSWLNTQLSDGRAFLLGPQPAAIDAQFYQRGLVLARPMGRRAVISVGIQRPCPLGSEYPGHRPWNLQRYGSAGCHFARK